MSFTNELSNLSYTNKDFNSIYPELLEYARKLSYKWDPTTSDESDPGIVLLKLAALIGDKDNYNIDKNILELMPVSVTQLPAAMQLFEQCGYTMRYFRSAEGDLSITINKNLGADVDEETEYSYSIPRFTMFTDADSSVVYTSTKPTTVLLNTEVVIPVIEGVIVDYSVINDSLITMQNLDYKNRLYFTESNIAENGIFITNVFSDSSTKNYDEWKRVDNLQTQPRGQKCFKFGLTLDTSLCYIEFPEDVESLIQEGLNISYVLTSGASGNISRRKIDKFYTDTKFKRESLLNHDVEDVDADIDSITIYNSLPISGGKDPESIDDAYKNYQRVRDTFQTLVSLKDYTDYMVSSDTASNGYVCDRTNDVQHSYKIVTSNGNSVYTKTLVEQQDSKLYEKSETGEFVPVKTDVMDAFDLCVYALKYDPEVSLNGFTNSFQIVSTPKLVFSDVKSLQHDYIDFDTNKILMFKNVYPIRASIVPRSTLSQTEKFQVLYNVETALYRALNSRQLDFGEGVSIELIQQTILNADERIKALVDFVSPTYETYAVYKTSNGNFEELRIDNDSDDGGYVPTKVRKGSTIQDKLYYKDTQGNFVEVSDNTALDYSKTYYTYDNTRHSLWNNFRAEVFTKNVLAGITPLYTDDNEYTTTVNQQNIREYNNFTSISSEVTLPFTKSSNGNNEPVDPEDTTVSKDDVVVSPFLNTNESILLPAPNLVEETNYSSYVKILYRLNSSKTDVITSKTKYELKNDDFIIFFYGTSESDVDYNYVKYDASSNSSAKFISPEGFSLSRVQILSQYSDAPDAESVLNHFANKPAGKGKTNNSIIINATNNKPCSESEYIADFLNKEKSNLVLTGTKVIRTYNISTIHINNNENGCSYVYWILNQRSNDEYSLSFDDNNEYVLRSGEYFIYTNDDKSTLFLLGEGTKLKTSIKSSSWSVKAIDYADLLIKGIEVLSDKWHKISKIDKTLDTTVSGGLWATEQQQILLGPGCSLNLKYQGSEVLTNFPIIDAKGVYLTDYEISYTESSNKIVPVDSTDVEWFARSILNINSSKTAPQKLSSGQKIILSYEDSIEEINAQTTGSTYVQFNQNINVVEGAELAPSIIDQLSCVSYTTDSTSNFSEELILTFDATDLDKKVQKQIEFELFNGSYLLQVLASDKITVELAAEGCETTTLSNPNVVQLHVNSSEGKSKITLVLTCLIKDYEGIVRIPALFRYKTDVLDTIRTKDDKSFEEQVLSRINQLDTAGIFNYVHKPINAIQNPLVATEFLRKEHFYNSYTICQWNSIVDNCITIHDVIR